MMRIEAHNKNTLVINGIENLGRETKQAVRKSLYDSGIDIAGHEGSNNSGIIKQSMKEAKSGRNYKVYRGIGGRRLARPRIHTASRKGEAIAILSGETRDNTYFKVTGWDRLEIGTRTIQGKVWEKSRNTYIKGILKGRKNIINNMQSQINAIK